MRASTILALGAAVIPAFVAAESAFIGCYTTFSSQYNGTATSSDDCVTFCGADYAWSGYVSTTGDCGCHAGSGTSDFPVYPKYLASGDADDCGDNTDVRRTETTFEFAGCYASVTYTEQIQANSFTRGASDCFYQCKDSAAAVVGYSSAMSVSCNCDLSGLASLGASETCGDDYLWVYTHASIGLDRRGE